MRVFVCVCVCERTFNHSIGVYFLNKCCSTSLIFVTANELVEDMEDA